MKRKNNPAKHSSRHIDIFGTKFVLPKGARRQLNKLYPELKDKKLDIRHLKKVKKVTTK